MNTCPMCSADIAPDANYCSSCGLSVLGEAPTHKVVMVNAPVYATLTAAEPVGTLPGNARLFILAEDGERSYVRRGTGERLWITSKYLELVDDADDDAAFGSLALDELPPSSVPSRVEPGRVLGMLAAAGIGIGTLLDWTRGGGFNSFQLPFQALFDKTTTSSDPKLGYVVAAVAGAAFIVLAAKGPVRLAALCGAGALLAAGLYAYQVNSALQSFSSSTSITDVLGPGPWITAIAGAVLVLSPLFNNNQGRGSTEGDETE